MHVHRLGHYDREILYFCKLNYIKIKARSHCTAFHLVGHSIVYQTNQMQHSGTLLIRSPMELGKGDLNAGQGIIRITGTNFVFFVTVNFLGLNKDDRNDEVIILVTVNGDSTVLPFSNSNHVSRKISIK